MKHALVRTLAMTLVAAVAVLSVPAQAKESRPFQLRMAGFANPKPTENPCVLLNTETGMVNATHVGNGTWSSTETVDLCARPDAAEVNGTFTITAADGSKINGSYATLAHLDFPNDQITFSGRFNIDGGTGRFADASGNGALAGSGKLSPGFDVEGFFTGQISY